MTFLFNFLRTFLLYYFESQILERSVYVIDIKAGIHSRILYLRLS